MSTKTFLSTVSFADLFMWDVKSYKRAKLNSNFELVELSKILIHQNKKIKLEKNKIHSILGVNNVSGIFDAYTISGDKVNQPYQEMRNGWLAYNPYRINVGSIGIKLEEHKNNYISPAYVVFSCNENLSPHYFFYLFKTDKFNTVIRDNTTGSVRQNLSFKNLSNIKIPLPSLEEQNKIVEAYNQKVKQAEQAEDEANRLEIEIENYIYSELGIKKQEKQEKKKGLQFVRFSKLDLWGIDKICNQIASDNSKYPIVSLESNSNLYTDLFRGKSPKYENGTNKFILNQKCNRWNEFELEHAKTVNEKWFNSIDQNAFTQKGDILINSTGEGTIGRSSCILDDNCIGLIYDSHLLLLRLNLDLVNPLYYTLIFNSDFGQYQVSNIKSAQSTNQTELGVGNLKKIQIPLPPLSKQNEIVEHIMSLKQRIKVLTEQAEQNRQQAIKDFENTIFN